MKDTLYLGVAILDSVVDMVDTERYAGVPETT